MTILLIILCSIAGLIALIFLGALLAPKSYSVYRSVVIDRPVEDVYDYVRHVVNQEYYNKWVQRGTKQTTKKGNDGEVGFIYAWNGDKQSGEGEMEITQLIPNQLVGTEIRFVRPFKAVAQGPTTLEALGPNQTKVTWGMDSPMTMPMNLILTLMNPDKLLGKDLQESLGNLKRILEQD
jgi:hypothetical protein